MVEMLGGLAQHRVAGLQRPRSVDFAEGLPHNPSGDLPKRALRAPYRSGPDPEGRSIS